MSDDMGTRAVRGVAWLGSGQVIRQVLAFATNIALARMLFPDDFGLFGMAFAAAEVAQILTDFGLGAALIQRREKDAVVLTTCFWLNLALGCVVCLALILAAPFIADFFRRPEIFLVLVPLALNMVIASAMVVPQALLTQEMRFRDITAAQTLSSICASICAVTAAAFGAGVWALVIQPATGNIVMGVMMYRSSRWRPRGRPQFSTVRGLLGFSGNMLGNSLLSCVGRNLHAAILGRQLGSNAVGMYNLASGITGTIVFQVSSVLVRVLFPTLSNLRDTPDRMRSAWFAACSGIALIAFPAMLGIIAVAEDFVLVVFGPQWIPMVDVLRILCGVMAVQSVLTTSGTVLMALGRSDILFLTSIASVLLIGSGLWLGSQFGLAQAATGYAVGTISTSLLLTVLACRQARFRLRDLMVELRPWTFASLLMAVGVGVLAESLSSLHPALRLGISVACGAVLYPLLLWFGARSRTRELIMAVSSRLKPGSK